MRYSAGTNAHNIDYSLATSTTINRELSEYILSYPLETTRDQKIRAEQIYLCKKADEIR